MVERRRWGALAAVALACALGAVSIGGDCGGESVGAEATAGVDAGRTEKSSASDATALVIGSSSGFNASSGGFDTGTAAPSTTGSGTSDNSETAGSSSEDEEDAGAAADGAIPNSVPACFPDYTPCGDGGFPGCCNFACTKGTCGTCHAEGERCMFDGGAPDGTTPCCGGLSCNRGYCGTNACVPDGMNCGGDAGVVCCNDDCNGTTCGP